MKRVRIKTEKSLPTSWLIRSGPSNYYLSLMSMDFAAYFYVNVLQGDLLISTFSEWHSSSKIWMRFIPALLIEP